MSVLVDSFTNVWQNSQLYSGSTIADGQTFYNGYTYDITLDSMKFLVMKKGSPPEEGDCHARLYAMTGTFGTNGKPTGDVLATSDVVSLADVPAYISSVWTEFTFSGSNRIILSPETYYCAVFVYDGGTDYTNCIYIVGDQDDSGYEHDAGNICASSDLSSWVGYDGHDNGYYVYANLSPTIQGISTIQGIQSITL